MKACQPTRNKVQLKKGLVSKKNYFSKRTSYQQEHTFRFLNGDPFLAEELEDVEGAVPCRVVPGGVAPLGARTQVSPVVQQQLDHVHVVVVL